MATNQSQPAPPPGKSKEIFQAAPAVHQELIRAILKDERDQMHLQVRKDIYRQVADHVRRLIK